MSQKRKNPRRNINIKGLVVDDTGVVIGDCVVADMSEGGAKITKFGSAIVPDKFKVALTKQGTVCRRCEVAWRTDLAIGIRFVLK